MSGYWMKSAGYFLALAAGYAMTQMEFTSQYVTRFLSRLIFWLVLPCAMLTSYSAGNYEGNLFTITLIAAAGTLTCCLASFLLHLNSAPASRALSMLSACGYETHLFILPLILAFFNENALAVFLYFELGSSLVYYGGVYTLSRLSLDHTRDLTFSRILITFLSSAPFTTALILSFFAFAKFQIPDPLLSTASAAGNAAPFLCFLLMGTQLGIKTGKSFINSSLQLLFLRYLVSAVLALLVYFVFPLDTISRQVCVLCLMAPVPAASAALAGKLDLRAMTPAAVSTISMVISLLLISILCTVFA